MSPSKNLYNIFNALVTCLKSVIDPNDASNGLLFANATNTTNPLGLFNIYNGPQPEFAGTPAAVIVPAPGANSKFISNYENERHYAFYVFIAMDTTLANYNKSRLNMMLIVDAVLDAIDRSDMLSNTADIVEAVSVQWSEEMDATGVNIVAPLKIMCMRTVQSQVN